ncbi:hypothetical protein NUM_65420 [Actinocatenispora comari]|uniref:Uncharacterized protein n=1 Tax=Actinocatenispora comari TaxID=2807577 RepID=A0A8J4AHK5_9ACTN|nr:hypothetical protein NUM_65420 [Actinocatenispora comari]
MPSISPANKIEDRKVATWIAATAGSPAARTRMCSPRSIIANSRIATTSRTRVERRPGSGSSAALDAGREPAEPGLEAGLEPDPEAGLEPDPEAGLEPDPEAGLEPDPEAGLEPDPEAGLEPGPEARLVMLSWSLRPVRPTGAQPTPAAGRPRDSGDRVTGGTAGTYGRGRIARCDRARSEEPEVTGLRRRRIPGAVTVLNRRSAGPGRPGSDQVERRGPHGPRSVPAGHALASVAE